MGGVNPGQRVWVATQAAVALVIRVDEQNVGTRIGCPARCDQQGEDNEELSEVLNHEQVVGFRGESREVRRQSITLGQPVLAAFGEGDALVALCFNIASGFKQLHSATTPDPCEGDTGLGGKDGLMRR